MRVHGMAPGLNYGQQALEGLKAYRGRDNGAISVFRPDVHARRMQHSAKVVSIPPIPEDMFIQACKSAVAYNAAFIPPYESGGCAYVRPLLYGSSPHLMMWAPDDYTFCVFVVPVGGIPSKAPIKTVIVDEFDRAAPNGTGHAKLGGNYAPVWQWNATAKGQGYGMILHMDSAKHEEIDEFSTAGFIGVFSSGQDDTTLVVPDSKCIIESVTSNTILDIAKSFGWKTERRPINYSELPEFDEVMAAGTYFSLVPIRSITRPVGRGNLPDSPKVSTAEGAETISYAADADDVGGPVFQKLLERIRGIQRLDLDDEFGWRFSATEDDLVKCPEARQ